MWFVGLILGSIIGSLISSDAAIFCGLLGTLFGLLYRQKYPANKPAAAISRTDARIDKLERRIGELESRLAILLQSQDVTRTDHVATTQDIPCPVPAQAAEPAAANRPFVAAIKPVEVPAEFAGLPLTWPAGTIDEVPDETSPHRKPDYSYDTTANSNFKPTLPNKLLQLLGEHTIAAIGVVILFIGIGFLVKYATEHAMFPIELRLASAVLTGIALLVTGWRLRERFAAYALILQGGGTGILYLTIYGAFQIWHMIPAGLAFPLLIGVAVLSTLLAVWQNSMALAILGVTGGFLAPLLTATETGSHVALFGYYAILNLGIFAAAWFKSWRPLNLLGFVFTFAIALLWGTQNYRPELFASTEPFLILFFLMYVAISILYALKRVISLKSYVDGGLIFGMPIAGSGLQAGLVKDFEYGMAISSLTLGAFYMVLSWFILRRRNDLRLLVESFLALGVIFISLAIPLACDAQWTSAAWAVEGAGIFWFGIRQSKTAAWGFGLLLQAGAGISFMLHASVVQLPAYPFNHLLIGALLLSVAGFVSYCAALRQLSNTADNKFSEWATLLFLWGLAWWLYGGLDDIDSYAAFDYKITLDLLFLTATAAISSLLSSRWKWPHAGWPVQAFTAVLWLAALAGIAEHGHPFAHFGWLAWVVALAAHYWMLHRHETGPSMKLYHTFHVWSYLLLAALGAWEMHWLSGEYQLRHNAWSVASLIVVPVLLLIAVSRPQLENFWPLNRHLDAYRQKGALPVIIALWLWTFYANLTHDGSSQPLPYLPLLNAIDLGHGLVMMSVAMWLMRIRDTPLYKKSVIARAGGAALFIWLNAILLRTLHHWSGVDYQFAVLMHSVLVQMALSLFWTLLAMALMITAARRSLRPLWVTGATLMGVVLIKLLLVDLAQSGTLERIVSFTGVGMLMLVISYFAPYPKKKEEAA